MSKGGRTPSKHAPQFSTVPAQSAGIGEPSLEVTQEILDMLTFLDGQKINAVTQHRLLSNGVDSIQALAALHVEDLLLLQLPLGHCRLLEKILSLGENTQLPQVHNTQLPRAHNTVQSHQGESLFTGSVPTPPPPQENTQPGLVNTDIFLGMGAHGSQKPYYDIMDFLPKRSPYDTSPDGNTVIVQRGDGSLVV